MRITDKINQTLTLDQISSLNFLKRRFCSAMRPIQNRFIQDWELHLGKDYVEIWDGRTDVRIFPAERRMEVTGRQKELLWRVLSPALKNFRMETSTSKQKKKPTMKSVRRDKIFRMRQI